MQVPGTRRPEGPPNRLAAEPSPYLQQHRHNPVDWWPWGPEAFAEAHRRGVPVFLSIGYATCHWCHVMAHESFEDPEVASLLNGSFVNVKVDREERPDVDDVYMAACQAMTGSGGWPLTIVMTPELKPFFAATYIPTSSRFGRMGLMELVPRITQAWQAQRADLERQADHLLAHMRGEPHVHEGEEHPGHAKPTNQRRQATGTTGTGSPESGARHSAAGLDRAVLIAGLDDLARRFDAHSGGFGGAPKFPSPHNLMLLLRLAGPQRPQALAMVETTLDAMAAGGIRDHLGGGFHRYSTDRHWLLPHFEKMLYDQAMLAMAYTEAHQATGHLRHAAVARSILDYVLRDLQDPGGAFHSAEDADSEGVEGKFYVWSHDEVLGVLGKEEGGLFCAAYGVVEQGNFHDEATREVTGLNVLHLPRPLPEVAEARGLTLESLEARLAASRTRLLDERCKRVRPLLDDKVLTDWNCLAVAAFAKAGIAFNEPRYVEAARRAGEFLVGRMMAGGRLRHRYKASAAGAGGVAVVDEHAFLDDHAFALWGFIELYEATHDPAWIAAARTVAKGLHARFWDPAGGHFGNPADGEALPLRRKEAYDGALPSGNGVAAWCLLRLARLTGAPEHESHAASTLEAFAPAIQDHPAAFGMSLVALDFALGPTRELLITEGPGRDVLIKAGREGLRPRQVLLASAPALGEEAPWTRGYKPVGGKAAAYVCTDHACQRPITEADALRMALGKNGQS